MELGLDVSVLLWAFMQAMFVFVSAFVIPMGRALGSFVVLLILGGWWGGGWRELLLAANPANQFCLISHCTLSPTSTPQRGGTLSYCVCQQR